MKPRAKRFFDLVLAILAILISLPIQIFIAIALWIELGENPLFVQERAVSYGNKHFYLIKFRTIRKEHSSLIASNGNPDKFLIRNFNFKISPFAAWIRKTGFDEILQIYNVLLGQMSFVGPRPLMVNELMTIKNKYPEQHCIRKNFNSLPGITGIWQLVGNRELGVGNLNDLDLFYEENKSFRIDIKIISFTVFYLLMNGKINSCKSKIHFVNGLNRISRKAGNSCYLLISKIGTGTFSLYILGNRRCFSAGSLKKKSIQKNYLKILG